MNKNVPKLRFKGFEDEWKKEVLGNLILEKVEKTDDKSKYPLYSLTIESGVVPKSDRYEREFLVKKEGNFKIVNNNDFVYNPMNLRFGALASYKGDFPVSVSGYYNIFSFKNKGLEKFWDNYLKTDRMMYLYNTIATGSLEEKKRVHYSQFKELKLPIPSLQEQEKIANFLSKVDSIIEKQEKKVEYWNSYKKGMMQKIFSQKIRFKDENGREYPEWKEKKLGEIFKITAGGDIKQENISDVIKENYIYPIYSNSLSDKGLYGYSNIYKIEGETITVTGRGFLGYAIARYNKYYPIVRLLVLKPVDNCNVKFFEELINNLKIFIESTGVPQLTAPQLSSIKVKYPCLEEQNKIAKISFGIDRIIEKDSEKLKYLKQWKKGLLQQMFV
ncbi:TPA: restriction endonuclease subunit S [Clostridium perfringens]